MHTPDSNLSAGGKDWSSAPWVDWGDNPNTAGPARLAVGNAADAPAVGPGGVLPWHIRATNQIRYTAANNIVAVTLLLASAAAGAGHLTYKYFTRK